jgi:heme-degrading monooxygenase HmoA
MTFIPEKVVDFLEVFNSSKHLIRNFAGCTHLELLNDIYNPNIFFTYSYWQSEKDLNVYRDSELFVGVWSKTKILFSAKAEAWSVEQKAVL